MHNWLIFQYHHIMRPYRSDVAKGMLPAFGLDDEPTHNVEVSNAGTQEGR